MLPTPSPTATPLHLQTNNPTHPTPVCCLSYTYRRFTYMLICLGFKQPATPPSPAYPTQDTTSAPRQPHNDSDDEEAAQRPPVQRKQGGYDSRVEQILYEHPEAQITITQAGKNVEGGGSYIAYTIRTGVRAQPYMSTTED